MNENIEILQCQFDAYCTKVLKYASISYYHANRRRMEHEVSFSSLLEKDLAEVSTADRYPCMVYHFQVWEWLIAVQSEPLGHAIEHLTPYRQEIILLYFFLGFKNKENGKICQSQFDSGNACKKRDQGLHIAENNGYCCKQPKICGFFIAHNLHCRVKFRRRFSGACGFYSFYYNFIGKADNGSA